MSALKTVFFTGAGLLALAYAGRYTERVVTVDLKNFKASEFREWWPVMNEDLLLRLDKWTTLLKQNVPGARVAISNNSAALGRAIRDDNEAGFGSLHNVVRWGSVRAVDVKPFVSTANGIRGLNYNEFITGERLAIEVACFTGVGVYPQWQRPGYHLDNRPDRKCGNPARWGGIVKDNRQIIVSRDQAIARFA